MQTPDPQPFRHAAAAVRLATEALDGVPMPESCRRAIAANVELLVDEINRATPKVKCPLCMGRNRVGCMFCGGAGAVSKDFLSLAPIEFIEAARETESH